MFAIARKSPREFQLERTTEYFSATSSHYTTTKSNQTSHLSASIIKDSQLQVTSANTVSKIEICSLRTGSKIMASGEAPHETEGVLTCAQTAVGWTYERDLCTNNVTQNSSEWQTKIYRDLRQQERSHSLSHDMDIDLLSGAGAWLHGEMSYGYPERLIMDSTRTNPLARRLPTTDIRTSAMETGRSPSHHSTLSPDSSTSSTADCSMSVNSMVQMTNQQAINIARNTEGDLDPDIIAYLEDAVTQIMKKLESHPESCFLSKGEFAVFKYYRQRFNGKFVEHPVDKGGVLLEAQRSGGVGAQLQAIPERAILVPPKNGRCITVHPVGSRCREISP